MSRMWLYVAPLIAAESWAQFIAHDRRLAAVFAVLALGAIAVYRLLAPKEECPADCRKCAESASVDPAYVPEGDR